MKVSRNFIRRFIRGGGISIFVHESLSFKRRQDLGINSEAGESLSIEILNEKCKNINLNTIYRPSNGDIETCKNKFKNLFAQNDTVNKHIALADDFNLNVQGYENNKKVQNFINLMFRYGMISNINKPTRVTANTATAIDHIVTNVIIHTNFKTGIVKGCISDHFVIMLAFQIGEKKMCNKSEQNIHKRSFNETSIESFRLRLRKIKWNNLKTCNNSNLFSLILLHPYTTTVFLG